MKRASIEHDKEDEARYAEALAAYHHYLAPLMPRLREQFRALAQGKTWDTTHFAYPYYFHSEYNEQASQTDSSSKELDGHDDDDDGDGDDDVEAKALYKHLCLVLHPDRCKDANATSMFQFVQQRWSERDIDTLRCLKEHLSKGAVASIDILLRTIQQQRDITLWKTEACFRWFVANDTTFQKMLVSPEELAERQARREVMERIKDRIRSWNTAGSTRKRARNTETHHTDESSTEKSRGFHS